MDNLFSYDRALLLNKVSECIIFKIISVLSYPLHLFSEDESYRSDGEFQDDHLLQMLRKQRGEYELQLR